MTAGITLPANRPSAARTARVPFLLRWTAVTVYAWFLIGLVLAATGETSELVWGPRLTDRQLMAVYLIMGTILGMLQWLALRGYLRGAVWWGAATFVGTMAGALFSFLLTPGDPRSATNNWLVDLLWIDGCVALLQCLTLYYEPVRRWYLWPLLKFLIVIATAVLGTAAGFLVGLPFGDMVRQIPQAHFPLPVISGADLVDLLTYGFFLAPYGFVFGVLTGMALAWLARQQPGPPPA